MYVNCKRKKESQSDAHMQHSSGKKKRKNMKTKQIEYIHTISLINFVVCVLACMLIRPILKDGLLEKLRNENIACFILKSLVFEYVCPSHILYLL